MSTHGVNVDTAIVSLIASGRAATRSALSNALNLAPSTISGHLQRLIDAGIVEQTSATHGRGRPVSQLRVTGADIRVAVIDLHGHHAELALMSLSGKPEHRQPIPVELKWGPEVVLEKICREIEDESIRACGISIPGPVDTARGVITQPSRMPGWADFPVRDWLTDRLKVQVIAENDANLLAYAEHQLRADAGNSTLTVLAGTGIGIGIMAEGELFRGATYASGNVTHYRTSNGDIPCSCGNRGCLETVASGAALVSLLRSQGVEVRRTEDVIALAHQGDPLATTAVRAAGEQLGQVLCAVVNFFNPHAIYLGGQLSTVGPFLAAVRADIYQGSHPLATQRLLVERTKVGSDGVLIGCGQLTIAETLGLPAKETA